MFICLVLPSLEIDGEVVLHSILRVETRIYVNTPSETGRVLPRGEAGDG